MEREILLTKALETPSEDHLIIIVEMKREGIIGWFDVKCYDDWFLVQKEVHIEHVNVASK